MGEVGQQEKLFLQAMIQSAVAFHHLEIGRPERPGKCTPEQRKNLRVWGPMFSCRSILKSTMAQLDTALSWLLTVPDPRRVNSARLSCAANHLAV